MSLKIIHHPREERKSEIEDAEETARLLEEATGQKRLIFDDESNDEDEKIGIR